MTTNIFLFDGFLLSWFYHDLSFRTFNFLLYSLYLFVNILYLLSCMLYFFLYHLIYFLKISQLFFEFSICLFTARFKPFRVYFLLALQLWQWTFRSFCFSSLYLWQSWLLCLQLNCYIVTFVYRVFTLSMLFFNQTYLFYCICYKSSSLVFKFLF